MRLRLVSTSTSVFVSVQDPAAVFGTAQHAAGVIAARHRGEPEGAEALLGSFPNGAARARGFYPLAELALRILKAQTGQTMDDLVQELSLRIAGAAGPEGR